MGAHSETAHSHCPSEHQEITMWNTSNPIEHRAGNSSPYPIGGIAPLLQERALHAYMEKKLMHADMDRYHPGWALKTAIVHAIQSAIRASGAAALRWLQEHVHQSAVVKPRA
jgi:hypothetical protein